MKIFTVYDSKAEAHLDPFVARTAGEAIRRFAMAANTTDHNFYKHAADFTLFEIGTWEDRTGVITKHEAKINLGTALEHKDSTNAS